MLFDIKQSLRTVKELYIYHEGFKTLMRIFSKTKCVNTYFWLPIQATAQKNWILNSYLFCYTRYTRVYEICAQNQWKKAYVRNILVWCVGTWSQIFDVMTVLDRLTCLFCVVRKTIRPDIILKNTTHIKKLKYGPILTKSYYILSAFVIWNRCNGIHFTAYRDLLQY